MNRKKTEVTVNRQTEIEEIVIQTELHILERESYYVYFGQLVQTTPSLTGYKDASDASRMLAGNKSNILKASLPICLGQKVFNQCALPIMTYGSET